MSDKLNIPTHGEYGGPLVSVVANYEDGSEHRIDHSAVAIASANVVESDFRNA